MKSIKKHKSSFKILNKIQNLLKFLALIQGGQITREDTRCRHMDYSFWLAATVLL